MRKAGNGDWPEPGADGAHDWIGWASGDAAAPCHRPGQRPHRQHQRARRRRRTSPCIMGRGLVRRLACPARAAVARHRQALARQLRGHAGGRDQQPSPSRCCPTCWPGPAAPVCLGKLPRHCCRAGTGGWRWTCRSRSSSTPGSSGSNGWRSSATTFPSNAVPPLGGHGGLAARPPRRRLGAAAIAASLLDQALDEALPAARGGEARRQTRPNGAGATCTSRRSPIRCCRH